MKIKFIITLFNVVVAFSQSSGQSLPLNAVDEINLKKITSNWGNSIVCLESIYQRGTSPTLKDTLTSTGFIINDNNKFYLVTVKHTIKSDYDGLNVSSANNSVFIKINQNSAEEKYLDLNNLSGAKLPGKSYIFSSDKNDIGIISLQTNKDILTYLLDHQISPIPIENVDVATNYAADNSIVQLSYSRVKGYKGRRIKAINVGKVAVYDTSSPFFSISSLIVHQGNNGAPIMSLKENKIIGMVCNEMKTLSNDDILKDPFFASTSAKVIKASYIISCLREFQIIENN